jgi:tetraacyldisaccharide 4'-kinase
VDGREPNVIQDGDEPTLLARSLPDAIVVVAPDRVQGAAVARRRGAAILLLDDGFQHRRLHRDLDIVLWDRRSAESRGRLLPRGPLREPVSALRRAGAIVSLDRGSGPPDPPDLGGREAAAFRGELRAFCLQAVSPRSEVHALSGLADPESFERSLTRLGLRLTGATRHPDHHLFTPQEILEAARRAEREGADHLATSAKDHVRWPRPPAGGVPTPAVFDVDVRLEDEEALVELALSTLSGGTA